ncbi:MAG: SEC-C metal-binding domain-containing protein, partial [Bradyrhizobium sp.]
MAKIGRNEPCPCGSGRKYKQCCLAKDEAAASAARAAQAPTRRPGFA